MSDAPFVEMAILALVDENAPKPLKIFKLMIIALHFSEAFLLLLSHMKWNHF